MIDQDAKGFANWVGFWIVNDRNIHLTEKEVNWFARFDEGLRDLGEHDSITLIRQLLPLGTTLPTFFEEVSLECKRAGVFDRHMKFLAQGDNDIPAFLSAMKDLTKVRGGSELGDTVFNVNHPPSAPPVASKFLNCDEDNDVADYSDFDPEADY
jgi:hypothetical protein